MRPGDHPGLLVSVHSSNRQPRQVRRWSEWRAAVRQVADCRGAGADGTGGCNTSVRRAEPVAHTALLEQGQVQLLRLAAEEPASSSRHYCPPGCRGGRRRRGTGAATGRTPQRQRMFHCEMPVARSFSRMSCSLACADNRICFKTHGRSLLPEVAPLRRPSSSPARHNAGDKPVQIAGCSALGNSDDPPPCRVEKMST